MNFGGQDDAAINHHELPSAGEGEVVIHPDDRVADAVLHMRIVGIPPGVDIGGFA
jgi:hypothetical protein